MNDSTLSSILAVLRQIPAFDHLTEIALKELSPLFSELALADGASLPIRRGHNEPYLYLISTGSFDLNLLNPDTPKQILITLNKTDLIGGFLSYASRTHEMSITSNGPCSVLKILKDDLSTFFDTHQEASSLFNKALRNIFYQAQLSLFFSVEFKVHDPEIFHSLTNEIQWKELQNGSVLFKQGDPGDAIYIVLSGRLKSVTQTPDGEKRLSNIIHAGEVSGEVAFLTQSERIATVFAVRDSVVARFSREGFDRLVERQPQSMLQIAKLLGHRFKFQSSTQHTSSFGKTYALIPSREEHCLNNFAAELRLAMLEWGSVICVTSSDVDRALGIKGISLRKDTNTYDTQVAQWLEQQEFLYDYVLLIADRKWNNWNDKLLHYSDHLLIISDADQGSEVSTTEEKILNAGRIAKHQNKSLILTHSDAKKTITGTRSWLNKRQLNDWIHIRSGVLGDMQRLGRLLTGNANALVLGGGGARGYAHIGVIRALEEQGIPIDRVCGTSVGAIISSALAMGYESKELIHLCKKHFQNLFDYTLPILSLIKGRRIGKELNAVFGEQLIEDLVIPFFCISTNLTRAEQIIHDRGSLKNAARSSMSLPAMIPPMLKSGDLIVDGGLLNNLPIDEMRKVAGDCNIIAVDISPKLDLTNNESFPHDISGFRLFISRINPFQRGIKAPSILQILERSITVAAVNYGVKIQEKNMADLYLDLPVETVDTLDYDKVDQIANLGYAASAGKIKDWASNSN